MKKILFFLAGLVMSFCIYAQVPQSIKYQAIVRDANGEVITNQLVQVKISLLQGAVDGTSVFSETHAVTPNNYGLVNLNIGTVNTADFQAIDWTTGSYFVKIELDGNLMGISQLMSVPYALHAATADDVDDADADNTNELLTSAVLNGTDLELTDAGGTTTVDLSSLATGVATEADPVFTAWDKTTGITITESQISDLQTYVKTEVDPTFIAWDKTTGISIIESQISDLKNYVETESDPVFDASAASGITTTDISSWNGKLDSYTESQDLSLDGYSLSISNGGSVDLPNVVDSIEKYAVTVDNPSMGDMLYYDGSDFVTVTPQDPTFKYRLEWSPDSNKPVWVATNLPSVDFNGTMYVHPTDNSTGIWWFNGTHEITNSISTTDGETNTSDIISIQGDGDYASSLCYNLEAFGYDDWYLPAKDELNAMYQKRYEIGGFGTVAYWSSTENTYNTVFPQVFSSGSQAIANKSSALRVRCVRRD